MPGPATGPVSGLDENNIGLSAAAGRSCDWEPGAAFVPTPVGLATRRLPCVSLPGAFLTAPWKDSLPAATERVTFCWIRSRLSFQGKHVFQSVGPPEGQENPADAEQRLPLARRAGVLVPPPTALTGTATLHRAHARGDLGVAAAGPLVGVKKAVSVGQRVALKRVPPRN